MEVVRRLVAGAAPRGVRLEPRALRGCKRRPAPRLAPDHVEDALGRGPVGGRRERQRGVLLELADEPVARSGGERRRARRERADDPRCRTR